MRFDASALDRLSSNSSPVSRHSVSRYERCASVIGSSPVFHSSGSRCSPGWSLSLVVFFMKRTKCKSFASRGVAAERAAWLPSRLSLGAQKKGRGRDRPELPAEIEEFRDQRWRREATRQVSNVLDAERFVDQVGFAACLTDSRRPGPSLYVAVCGRRDVVLPRNVQKDEEASAAWLLKDDIIRRGKVYYAKLSRGKTMFIAPRMVPYFHAIWGMRKAQEKIRL